MGKKTVGLVAAVILIFIVPVSLCAQTIYGYWKSLDGKGVPTAFWKLSERDGMLFGRILKTVERAGNKLAENAAASYPRHPESRPLNSLGILDVDWIYNMVPRPDSLTRFTGGWIINPEDGNRYALDLNILPSDHANAVEGIETLELKAKVLVFSRSQYWVRSDLAEMSNF